jgi:hypothetical protein
MTEGHTFIGLAAKNISSRNNFYAPGHPRMAGKTDTSPQSGAVRFVNPELIDFRVSMGAPVIDRGVPLAAVPADYDGQLRPQGKAYDIGALEYLMSGSLPPRSSSSAN